jgi:exosortase
MSETSQPVRVTIAQAVGGWLVGSTALAAVIWAYWPTLLEAAERWSGDPQYSHGYLVPLFSMFHLWYRRDVLGTGTAPRASWLGLVVLAVGLGLRFVGTVLFIGWLDVVSFGVCLLGIAGLIFGRAGLAWAWPAALFLIFMAPLPFRVQHMLGVQLQGIVTKASTYSLITLGVPAVANGNVITLSNNIQLGVVQACSGLGMMMTFAALATALTMIIGRKEPWFVGAMVVLATLPVAIAANVFRVCLTGLLYHLSQDEAARVVFHDAAGWLMIVVGLLGLLAVRWACRRTVVPVLPLDPYSVDERSTVLQTA